MTLNELENHLDEWRKRLVAHKSKRPKTIAEIKEWTGELEAIKSCLGAAAVMLRNAERFAALTKAISLNVIQNGGEYAVAHPDSIAWLSSLGKLPKEFDLVPLGQVNAWKGENRK